MTHALFIKPKKEAWNKGMIVGPKPPFKLKEVWAIRIRLQISGDVRNLALFNLAIDSKLRACDLVCLRVSDLTQGYNVVRRATTMQLDLLAAHSDRQVTNPLASSRFNSTFDTLR